MNTEFEKQVEAAYSLLRETAIERREEFDVARFQDFVDTVSTGKYVTPSYVAPFITSVASLGLVRS